MLCVVWAVTEARSIFTAANWIKGPSNQTQLGSSHFGLKLGLQLSRNVPLKVFGTFSEGTFDANWHEALKWDVSAWCDLTPAALKQSLRQDYLSKHVRPVAVQALAVFAGLCFILKILYESKNAGSCWWLQWWPLMRTLSAIDSEIKEPACTRAC